MLLATRRRPFKHLELRTKLLGRLVFTHSKEPRNSFTLTFTHTHTHTSFLPSHSFTKSLSLTLSFSLLFLLLRSTLTPRAKIKRQHRQAQRRITRRHHSTVFSYSSNRRIMRLRLCYVYTVCVLECVRIFLYSHFSTSSFSRYIYFFDKIHIRNVGSIAKLPFYS